MFTFYLYNRVYFFVNVVSVREPYSLFCSKGPPIFIEDMTKDGTWIISAMEHEEMLITTQTGFKLYAKVDARFELTFELMYTCVFDSDKYYCALQINCILDHAKYFKKYLCESVTFEVKNGTIFLFSTL